MVTIPKSFPEKTNMEAIKQIAHAFANFDVNYLRLGIVDHPFFTSSVYAKPFTEKKGKYETLAVWNLTDAHDLEEARQQLHNVINKIKTYTQFQFTMNRRYASAFFKYTFEYLDKQDYCDALMLLFTTLEYANDDTNLTLSDFTRLFRRCPTVDFIELPEDKEHYEALPDVITIYRGVKPKAKVKALSWTDKLETAQWFADRFEKNGKVYKAQINKKDVLVYTNQRDESELIVNFRKLQNIEEME